MNAKVEFCFVLCLLSAVAGLYADVKSSGEISYTIIKGEAKKSADGNSSSWENYLEIKGLSGKVTLCPTSLYKGVSGYDDFSGFNPSQLKVRYLDNKKTLILVQTDTHRQGSGGWYIYGRIILQLNETRNGFLELYRNFFMGLASAGWMGSGISSEEIFYDEGSMFIIISRTEKDIFRAKEKIPMSTYVAQLSGGVYERKVIRTQIFTCQIKNGKLSPLTCVSYANCGVEKYSATEFREFCLEQKITPLDKNSTAFPVVTEFSRPQSISVETYEQARIE